MGKVEWGPEIKCDGLPKGIDANEKIDVKWNGEDWYSEMQKEPNGADYDCIESPYEVTSIRLRTDHWYYQQQPIKLNDYNDYQALRDVLDEAFNQAVNGKGKERHANGNAWLMQPIFEIGRMVGVGFNTGQAIKKLQESSRMEPDAAVRELLGAIVYAASAIQLIRETSQHNNETENAE